MATLTLDSVSSSATRGAAPKAGSAASGWFAKAFHAIAEAKARRAQAHVDGYLAGLNDETLIDLGLDPAAVRHGDPLKRFPL